jgi:hypothetical protein
MLGYIASTTNLALATLTWLAKAALGLGMPVVNLYLSTFFIATNV